MSKEILRKINIISFYFVCQLEHEATICQFGNSDFWIWQVQIAKSTYVAKNYLQMHSQVNISENWTRLKVSPVQFIYHEFRYTCM